MPERMLSYHVGLLRKHKLPVISVILYPFETTLPEPPYIERNRKKELLRFDYQVVALWTYDARQVVQDRFIPMYAFLPVMKNTSVPLLIEALGEMKRYYTRDAFINHIARFKVILNRSTSLTEQEKQMVREEIYEYNSLFDNDPEVMERVAKGQVEVAHKFLTDIVEFRFPGLTEMVRQRTATIENIEILSQLTKQLAVAKDEQMARWVLDTYAAA